VYAVIDVETTGLRPSWHDRIVEIAIVQVDAAGDAQAEWCTLVNPQRDLGPQQIHGITAAEARRAPRFEQLAGVVAGLLRGRMPVAHNWAFDLQFLTAEYERLGIAAPLRYETGLCTMRLAGQFLPVAGRGLADCCSCAGIPLTQAHSALHDARAAADLLAYFLSVAGRPPPWLSRLGSGSKDGWPVLPTADVALVRRQVEGLVEEHFLARLVDRLPRTYRPDADAYLEILDRALLDRHISATEADALVGVADTLGLGRADVTALHEQYLQALAVVAAADGTVTSDEQQHLATVAELLGLDSGHVGLTLRVAHHALALAGNAHISGSARLRLQPGDTVVFTGEMDQPRDVWEARAANAGLHVGQDVTRHTRLLVAADPDSMSGKARKAAKYGIPVVHPAAFLQMLPS